MVKVGKEREFTVSGDSSLFHLFLFTLRQPAARRRLQEVPPVRRGPARAVGEDGGVRGQHHAALLAPEQRPGRPAVDIDVCLSLSSSFALV